MIEKGRLGNAQKMLVFDSVTLHFGAAMALWNVTFDVKKEEILAIIGPNGAGKTSILNCISGYYRPEHGQIIYKGKDLIRIPVHRIATMGIARTFQNVELFHELTTIENIMLGRGQFIKNNILAQSIYFGWSQKTEIENRKIAEDILDFLELKPYRKKNVGLLPYGIQKRVQLGQSLAMEPELLLLDEPMAGMNLEEKEDIVRFILDVYEEKKTSIILIEHDMGVVMDIADRIIVMDFGIKISEGDPETVKSDTQVIKAYLGEE